MVAGGASARVVTGQLYDTIGTTYTSTRRTDPRIAHQIWSALGDAQTVVNVGAGTGSYEPIDRRVLAVEPSAVMRAQRRPDSAPCVAATAERLPFKDGSFDAAMAIATIHHWRDPLGGLRELRRVARRVVVFTFDAQVLDQFWLTRDYLPELRRLLAEHLSTQDKAAVIGARIEPVLVPWDCTDGFPEAYWRRPEAYLDERVRRGMSIWTTLGTDVERRFVETLSDDLATGRWHDRNRDLVGLHAADLGLRLLVG